MLLLYSYAPAFQEPVDGREVVVCAGQVGSLPLPITQEYVVSLANVERFPVADDIRLLPDPTVAFPDEDGEKAYASDDL